MSNLVTTLCQRRKFGSATVKTVIMYMADRASDDGSGVWTSKAHIADDTELSKRTVQTAIKELTAKGLVRETGTRRHQHGFTIEYQINLGVVSALVSTRDDGVREIHGVQEIHPSGATVSPHGVREIHPNHPLTTHEPPKENPQPPLDDKSGSGGRQTNLPAKSVSQQKMAGDLHEGCDSLEVEFEKVWEHFPRKVGKGGARKAWVKARRSASFDDIAKPLGQWIRNQKGTDPKFIPHFATWLNQERWQDDQTHATNRAATSSDRLDRLGASDGGSDALPGPRKLPEIEWRPEQ